MPRVNPAVRKARERSLQELCERLGYTFKDLSLLDRALTHASMGNEGKQSYERLEFLGDAFLNFAVADVLYRQDAEVAEGQLTETRARIVSRQPLARAARALVTPPSISTAPSTDSIRSQRIRALPRSLSRSPLPDRRWV